MREGERESERERERGREREAFGGTKLIKVPDATEILVGGKKLFS